MIDEFKELSDEEVDLMLHVPVLVSILIAGADSNIDKNETKEAVSVMKLKPQKSRKSLVDYYRLAGEDFEDKLKITIHDLPSDTEERNQIIINELKKLNDIFPKLDKSFSIKFYEDIKDFAKKIAEASGGVLGFMPIGYEESKVIELSMIKDPSKK